MSDAPSESLRRTSLYDAHVAAGAKLVPFAGWEMPVQYAPGIKAEHLNVRTAAGLFDVSHMGEIETTGPQATEFLPTDWLTALRALEGSAWAREAFGAEFLKVYLAIKHVEYAQFTGEVGEQDWRWFLAHA